MAASYLGEVYLGALMGMLGKQENGASRANREPFKQVVTSTGDM